MSAAEPETCAAAARRPVILFAGLSTYAMHGGIQRFNRRVVDALCGIGETRLLMLGDSEAQLRAGAPRAAVTRGAGGSRPRLFAALPRLARGTDLLLLGHINLLPLAVLYKLLNPRGRVLLFAHGIEVWDDPRFRRVKPYEPFLLRRSVDRIASVSRYTRDRMSAAFGVPAERFTVFPNAVPVVPRAPRRAAAPVVLAVTRLGAGEREKHVDKLIQALPQVIRLVPDVRLRIIGEGPLRAELGAQAAALGLADRVTFSGAVSDEELAAAYAAAAVFALPSSKEGFGIVYLEAWLHGLPVIGSRFGAGGEVIDDGQDGFTVDPADVPMLAARLTALLSDAALAARFAETGRAKVEALYSEAAFSARLAGLVAELTGRPADVRQGTS